MKKQAIAKLVTGKSCFYAWFHPVSFRECFSTTSDSSVHMVLFIPLLQPWTYDLADTCIWSSR